MKNNFFLKKKNLYTYSFSPFIISLYKEDIVQLVEVIKSNYSDAKIFIGKDGLDFDLSNRIDLEEFFKNEEIANKIYNSLYIRILTGQNENDPYLIIEVDQYSYNYILCGKDKKLNKIKNEILKILRHNRVYKFIKNPLTIGITILFDIFFFLFIIKFKDLVEKQINFSFSYISLLMIFFIVNLIFILPSGKNRIFLKPKKQVPILKRAPETIAFSGMFIIFVVLFIVGFFLKII
ncbi:MAG: hypothetical protein N2258_03265 [Brevinematales bacterium]|nr:hypothetical protein [Brevinematales bacterium]